ncbi:conserved Plasmodium protein, unknown function [Plasmodium vivax]|nr:conserved Plasmodium protein, unknown function [Plasmodium vivax]
MRDERLPPFCASSASSQAKRRTPKYSYEDFKTENEIFFNCPAQMRNMYNNLLSGSNSFDAFEARGVAAPIDARGVAAPIDGSVERSSAIRSKHRGGSAPTCRHTEQLEQRAEKCTWSADESNQDKTCPPPQMEEESASLLRHTSRCNSACLHSPNQTVHGTRFTREHTKCRVKKRRTLAKCRTFQMERNYKSYYARAQREKRNDVFRKRKKKKAVRGGTTLPGEMSQRNIPPFASHPLMEGDQFEHVSPSTHAYHMGGVSHMAFPPEEAHLERMLPPEDTLDRPNREKYLAYISHSIKRQERKLSCFERNADRMLDLVELVLYNRMKEAFFLKERICDRERYRELCPDVFFFANDDDLIEAMDRNRRFLPKVPAKQNLTTYLGPSPSSIFGEHYSTYKDFFKLVRVDLKRYKWPDPYDAANTVRNKNVERVNCSDLLSSYKMGVNSPCGDGIRVATKVGKAGGTAKKRNPFLPFLPILQSPPTRELAQPTEYVCVDRIPPELIHLLNYRKVTLR